MMPLNRFRKDQGPAARGDDSAAGAAQEGLRWEQPRQTACGLPRHDRRREPAISQRRRLDMTYRAMRDKTETRRLVAPYRLLFFDGRST